MATFRKAHNSSTVMFSEIRNQPKRQMVQQAISLAMIITSALMIWKGLIVITKSESPIVVVLSGSMEPGFARGDILFLNQPRGAVHTGDIVVYNTNHRDIPIVHRIIKVPSSFVR
eukprot:jgi/Picre1/29858/NNA_005240.t1